MPRLVTARRTGRTGHEPASHEPSSHRTPVEQPELGGPVRFGVVVRAKRKNGTNHPERRTGPVRYTGAPRRVRTGNNKSRRAKGDRKRLVSRRRACVSEELGGSGITKKKKEKT